LRGYSDIPETLPPPSAQIAARAWPDGASRVMSNELQLTA
jgi:hypothetical protein